MTQISVILTQKSISEKSINPAVFERNQDCTLLDTVMETTFYQKLKEIIFFLSYRMMRLMRASVLCNPFSSLLINPICSGVSGAEPCWAAINLGTKITEQSLYGKVFVH